MLLVTLVLLCVVQSTSLSEQVSLIIACLIVGLIFVGEVLTVVRVVVKVNFRKAFDDLKNPFADKSDDDKVKKKVIEKNLDLLGNDTVEIIPPDSVRNGLFTPKDKMIDWEARNTEEYESLRNKDHLPDEPGAPHDKQPQENLSDLNEDHSEKDDKLNELEFLKKRLRNNLKVKRESESKKTD